MDEANDEEWRTRQQFNHYLTDLRDYNSTPKLNILIGICVIVIVSLIIFLSVDNKWKNDVLLTIFMVLFIGTIVIVIVKIYYLSLRDIVANEMIYLLYAKESDDTKENIKTFMELGNNKYNLVLDPSEQDYFSERINIYYNKQL